MMWLRAGVQRCGLNGALERLFVESSTRQSDTTQNNYTSKII